MGDCLFLLLLCYRQLCRHCCRRARRPAADTTRTVLGDDMCQKQGLAIGCRSTDEAVRDLTQELQQCADVRESDNLLDADSPAVAQASETDSYRLGEATSATPCLENLGER